MACHLVDDGALGAPGEVRNHAEMFADAEFEVAIRITVDIKGVRIFEDCLVFAYQIHNVILLCVWAGLVTSKIDDLQWVDRY